MAIVDALVCDDVLNCLIRPESFADVLPLEYFGLFDDLLILCSLFHATQDIIINLRLFVEAVDVELTVYLTIDQTPRWPSFAYLLDLFGLCAHYSLQLIPSLRHLSHFLLELELVDVPDFGRFGCDCD